jgi:hypothetical protein
MKQLAILSRAPSMMDSHAMKSHVLVFVAYGQEGAKNYPWTHATTFGTLMAI